MLDKAKQPVSAADTMKIGDYRFIPGTGVCIYSGNEEIEYGGLKELYYVLRPVGKPDTKVRKPSSKWSDEEFPPVANAQTINDIFKILSGNKKEKRSRWAIQEKEFRKKLHQPDLRETAEVVHFILSKHRRSEPKIDVDKLYDTAPIDVNLNYSARMMVNAALDILTPILALRCGLDDAEARNMLIRATVQKGYKEYKKLSDIAGDQTGLSAKAFQEAFGQARKAAAKVVDGGRIEYMPPSNDDKKRRRPTQKDYDRAAALDRATDLRAEQIKSRKQQSAKKRQAERARANRKASSSGQSKKPSGTKKRSSSPHSNKKAVNILPQNSEAYAKVRAELPKSPTVISVFNLAAGVLKHPDDLKIAAKLWFVRRENRLEHSQIREQFDIPSSEYLERLKTIKKSIEDAAKERNLKSISRVSLKLPKEGRKKRTGSDRTKKALLVPKIKEAKEVLVKQVSSDQSHRTVFNLAARTFKYPVELATVTVLWLASPQHKKTHEEVRGKLGLNEKKYNKFIKETFEDLHNAANEENIRAFTRVKFDFSDSQRIMGNSMTYSIDESAIISQTRAPN